MKVTKIYEKLYKIEAEDGKKFSLKDHTAVYDNILYVPNTDSATKYEEITTEEAEALKKVIESSYMK